MKEIKPFHIVQTVYSDPLVKVDESKATELFPIILMGATPLSGPRGAPMLNLSPNSSANQPAEPEAQAPADESPKDPTSSVIDNVSPSPDGSNGREQSPTHPSSMSDDPAGPVDAGKVNLNPTVTISTLDG